MRISENRSAEANAFFLFLYVITLYIPRYLGVSWEPRESLTRIADKRNLQTTILTSCLHRHVFSRWHAGQKSRCPGIALSQHAAELRFITPRAISFNVKMESIDTINDTLGRRGLP